MRVLLATDGSAAAGVGVRLVGAIRWPRDAVIRVVAARDCRADLIVTGTHGRTGLTRLVLGSVARNVLHHADCSVLVSRQPAEVRAEPIATDAAPVRARSARREQACVC
jgi:hypothetical protein